MVGIADRGPVSIARAATAEVVADVAPRFSVLCSAWNCEKYLASTIDSVIAQTEPDWELIVVDNGMSEEIAEIVRGYSHDPRVRLLRQENNGLIGGIATAAAASTGRHLVPLDSDDQLLPDFCRRMAEVLEQRPEIDALSCDALIFLDDGLDLDQARRFLRSRTGLGHPLTTIDIIGRHDVIPYFAVFRRAAWFAAGGYAQGTEMVEDIGLFLRLITSGHDVRVLTEPLARYRYRKDSVSRDPSSVEDFDDRRERLYTDAAEATGDPATLRALQGRLRALHYQEALRRARFAFVQGDLDAARAAATRAIREQFTVRSSMIVIGIWLAPELLHAFHPVKRWITRGLSRIAAVLVSRRFRLFSR